MRRDRGNHAHVPSDRLGSLVWAVHGGHVRGQGMDQLVAWVVFFDCRGGERMEGTTVSFRFCLWLGTCARFAKGADHMSSLACRWLNSSLGRRNGGRSIGTGYCCSGDHLVCRGGVDVVSLLMCNAEVVSLSFRTPTLVLLPVGMVPSILYNICAGSRKSALLTDVLALSFSHNALSILKLDSFKTGCILLTGLFFYDIYWVFGTEVVRGAGQMLGC